MSYVIKTNVILDGVARKINAMNTGYAIYTEPVLQDVSLPAFFVGTPTGFFKTDHPANRSNLDFPVTVSFEIEPEPIGSSKFNLFRDIYDALEYALSEFIFVFPQGYEGNDGICLRTKDFKGTMNLEELIVSFTVMCRVKIFEEDLVPINKVTTEYSVSGG